MAEFCGGGVVFVVGEDDLGEMEDEVDDEDELGCRDEGEELLLLLLLLWLLLLVGVVETAIEGDAIEFCAVVVLLVPASPFM